MWPKTYLTHLFYSRLLITALAELPCEVVRQVSDFAANNQLQFASTHFWICLRFRTVKLRQHSCLRWEVEFSDPITEDSLCWPTLVHWCTITSWSGDIGVCLSVFVCMCVCVCVCVVEWKWLCLTNGIGLWSLPGGQVVILYNVCMCMCMCVYILYIYIYSGTCTCMASLGHPWMTHTLYIYILLIYIYIYICSRKVG